jgi:hypothetical protein
MEIASLSGTLVPITQTTWRHIPQDRNLDTHHYTWLWPRDQSPGPYRDGPVPIPGQSIRDLLHSGTGQGFLRVLIRLSPTSYRGLG